MPEETDESVIKIGDDGKPVQLIAPNGTIFNFNWDNNESMRVTAISPEGGLEVNFHISENDTAVVPSAKQNFPQFH